MTASQGRPSIAPRYAVASLASALVLLAVVSRAPQGLFSDAGWVLSGTRAAVAAHGYGPNWSVGPDPADLSRSLVGWGTWWAFGLAFLVDWLRHLGLSVGGAVRLLFALFLLSGSAGWALWFSLFRMPRRVLLALALLFPWTHYVSALAFTFSFEVFVFGAVPWLLLAGLALRRRLAGAPTWRDVALALAVGLGLGGVYVLKYAIVLTTLGIAAFVVLGALLLLPDETPGHGPLRASIRSAIARLRPVRVAAFVALGAGFLLPIETVNAINHHRAGTANLVTAAPHVGVSPIAVPFAAGNPTLAWADLDGLLRYTLMHPGHPLIASEEALWPAALVGAVLLWCVLLARARTGARVAASGPTWSDAGLLALLVYAIASLALLAIWTTSSAVSFEARHLAGAGITLMPLVIEAGFALAATASKPVRGALALAGLAFVALPLGYGVGAALGKVRRTPADFHPGVAHIANPLLASGDVAGCVAALQRFRGPDDIWYVADPVSALDIAPPAIVRQADFESIDDLRRLHYASSLPRRVVLLLPPDLGASEKGSVIRASFTGAGAWTRRDVPPCSVALWETTLQATPTAAAAPSTSPTFPTRESGAASSQ